MDPLDHRLALPDGLRCTVCDERVPVERLRLLARRDELAFLQIDCERCRSTTIGFVDGTADDQPAPAGAAPIDANDVLDMHLFLASWTGDLASLVADERHRAEPGA